MFVTIPSLIKDIIYLIDLRWKTPGVGWILECIHQVRPESAPAAVTVCGTDSVEAQELKKSLLAHDGDAPDYYFFAKHLK